MGALVIPLIGFVNQYLVSQELTIQFFLHLLTLVSHVMTRREFMRMSLLSARPGMFVYLLIGNGASFVLMGQSSTRKSSLVSGGLILTAILLKTFTASMMTSTRRLEIQEFNLEEQ